MEKLTPEQISIATENYRYALTLQSSEEEFDRILGSDIMRDMSLEEILCVKFEMDLVDGFGGDFRSFWINRMEILWSEEVLLDMIETNFPEHWIVLQKLLPFQ